MKKVMGMAIGLMMACAASTTAHAQLGKKSASKEPIEISSDALDVQQNEHKAIFTGNVIAVQGTSKMRSEKMTVFYAGDDANAGSTEAGQGIKRIEATGNVVFTTATETAVGDMGIYDVAADTIDLIGKNVTLTRDKNVLKGTKLNYNMSTGRSILTGGATNGGGSSRVHGLFVPKSDKAGAK